MLDLTKIKFDKSPNVSSRGGVKITHIVIHTMQGTMAGSEAWFKNPASQVSAHYLISKKAEIVQMVLDKDKAWHVMNANPFCLGIELEDMDPVTKKNSTNDPNWCTAVELEKAAQLVAALMKKYLVPIQNVIGHNDPYLKQFGNNHQDPGVYFDWPKFRTMVTAALVPITVPAPVPTLVSAAANYAAANTAAAVAYAAANAAAATAYAASNAKATAAYIAELGKVTDGSK